MCLIQINFSLHPLLGRDGEQIQIMVVAICLIALGVNMHILFIKWSYIVSPQIVSSVEHRIASIS